MFLLLVILIGIGPVIIIFGIELFANLQLVVDIEGIVCIRVNAKLSEHLGSRGGGSIEVVRLAAH